MNSNVDRRTFLKNAAAASATISILKPQTAFGTGANSAVRLGIIGCGNRGTAVITSMVNNTDARIVAIADLFEDQLLKGKENLNRVIREKGHTEIKDSQCFLGSKAYLKLLDRKDVDAVLISTPTFVHPVHLEAAVSAGKHVYCEKPVATDVAGVKRVRRAGKNAGDNQSITIGLQIRHASPYVEMVKRIHRGDIGEIVTAQIYYFAGAIPLIWRTDVSYDEARLRTWFWDRALSGSILLDQGIHILDICNWILQCHPIYASGMGGRKGRKDQGDAWGHFQALYEYPNEIHVSFNSIQFDPGYGDVCVRFFGTKGIAEAHYTGGVFIKGENEWDSGVARGTAETINKEQWGAGTFKSSLEDADPNKQKAFIESIKTGAYINEVHIGTQATLSAILGRTAAYEGRKLSWDQVVNSNNHIDPILDITQFDRK